jgi:ankyrin repeat protein
VEIEMPATRTAPTLEMRLEEAITEGDAGALMRVLRAFPDLDATLPMGMTPLHLAIAADLPGVVSILVDAGASPEVRDAQDRTALMAAASTAGAHVLRVLIDAGADLDATFSPTKPSSAWHFAAAGGNVPALTLLLPTVAHIDAKGGFGRTALCWAAQFRHAEAVAYLMAHGADPGIRDDDGTSPRDWAERNGDDETLAILTAAAGTA